MYEEFVEKVKTISYLGDAGMILKWDQEVMMPEGGVAARSNQRSAITRIKHEKLTSERMRELIEELEDSDLNERQEAVVREISRNHQRESKVPKDLKQRISEKGTESAESWRKAREESEWSMFAEDLREMVELKRKYAKHIDPNRAPYRVLFEDYEPYISFERVEQLMERLKNELPEIMEKVRQSEVNLDTSALEKSLSDEENMELAHRAAEIIGFDFNHGRLDTSTHPFTNGNQFDTRITTRFNENSVAENIAVSLHEGGHGLYQQGLPKEDYGTPLGKSRELSVHESQSRLWENHVGRSKAFWEYFVGEMRDISSEFDEVTPERCYKAVNSVDFENVIRTEADEISYHLHIVLRFELGQMLINGEIDVNDLPELWNDKMEEYLGVRPEDDAEGVLQDIHWSWGSFGYFPTYSLGTMLAAQLHSKAQEEIENLDRKISDGETGPLLSWLRENIHSKGQLRETDHLIKEVTGEPLTADYLMEHLRSRYGQIHEIEF